MSKLEIGTVLTETLQAIGSDANPEEPYAKLHSDVSQLAKANEISEEAITELVWVPTSSARIDTFDYALNRVLKSTTKLPILSENGGEYDRLETRAFAGTGTMLAAQANDEHAIMGFWHNPDEEVESEYGSGVPYAIKKMADAMLAYTVHHTDASVNVGYQYIEEVQRRLGIHTSPDGHHLGSALVYARPSRPSSPFLYGDAFIAGASGVLTTNTVRQGWLHNPAMRQLIEDGKNKGLYKWEKDICAGGVDSKFARAVLETCVGFDEVPYVDLTFTDHLYKDVNVH